jgi:hypothetical protein
VKLGSPKRDFGFYGEALTPENYGEKKRGIIVEEIPRAFIRTGRVD